MLYKPTHLQGARFRLEANAGAQVVTAGWVERAAMRLLDAFYELSGGNPIAAVPVQDSEAGEGAARKAGLDSDSTECGVAVRYLLNQGYVKGVGSPASAYKITVPGIDRAREMRGLGGGDPIEKGDTMSDEAQKRLVTLLSITIAMGLSQPVSNFIHEQIPERRGIKDDLAEALLEGLVRTIAFFLASLLVRQLAGRS